MSEQKTQEDIYREKKAEWDKENLRSILSQKWGQGFIWRLLETCNVFSQSLVPDNQNLTAFNEGRRSIGLSLLTQVLEINPEAYIEMTKVAKKEDKLLKQAIENDLKQKEKEDA